MLDSSVPGCGANPHNLAEAEGAVRVVDGDIGEPAAWEAIRGADLIFNLAGEISHIHSMRWPERDAALNSTAHLRFLQACARESPGVRVVYAGTRQIYGIPRYLPVNEAHPVQPVDFNGIHKYAATAYHLLWSGMGKVDSRVICLTNIYGPRQALRIPCQGFLGSFLRRSLLGQRLEVFGDGRQLRDPLYVDDAVDAFLLAGASENPKSRVWNVGGGESYSLAAIAELMTRAAGSPEPVLRPFPEDQKRIDIGSYYTDITRIREELGWQPRTSLETGIGRSLEFFRREMPHYLQPGDEAPTCALAQAVPTR